MTDLTTWIDVCRLSDIPKNTGICAEHQGKQVALFHLNSAQLGGISAIKAVANYDPFGHANVLSRGLITEMDEQYFVASPLLKQQFCLNTGLCQQDETVSIATFDARINDGLVQLREG
ncbi:MAG: nitrite reductase small subunit NirD [Gammaproteobacteria bacterium]|nr:nitrite reductase small subunit NirD [Gammaproteobacteria bacterium]